MMMINNNNGGKQHLIRGGVSSIFQSNCWRQRHFCKNCSFFYVRDEKNTQYYNCASIVLTLGSLRQTKTRLLFLHYDLRQSLHVLAEWSSECVCVCECVCARARREKTARSLLRSSSLPRNCQDDSRSHSLLRPDNWRLALATLTALGDFKDSRRFRRRCSATHLDPTRQNYAI